MQFYRDILNSKYVPHFVKYFLEKVAKKFYYHLYQKNIFSCDRYHLNILGYEFDLYLDWRDKTDVLYIINEIWEKPNTNFLISKLKSQKDCVFMDVGANIGYFSLLANQVGGDAVTVYAIEPLKRNIYAIEQAAKNTKIKILGIAVSDTDGPVDLGSRVTNSGSPSVVNFFGIGKPVNEVFMAHEMVMSKKLSTIFQEEGINRCHILKMDIQGAEFITLQASEELLRDRKIDYFIIEHNPQVYGEKVNELLASYGYKGYKINPDGTLTSIDRFISKVDYLYTHLPV